MSIDSLSILIPTHNRCEILARTLESMRSLECPEGVRVDVVVVANACSDDTLQVAESGIAEVPFPGRVIIEPVPGLTVARNRSIAESSGQVCAFIDDDVWLDAKWLVGLVEAFNEHEADLVAGQIKLWWEESERPNWLPEIANSLLSQNDLGDSVLSISHPWDVVGANFAFRRSIFSKIGGFKAGLGRTGKLLLSGEESDFTRRALGAGYRVVYTPHASLKHWVPTDRVTKKYLTGVSFGNGVSRILMKPRLSLLGYTRSFVGHLWLGIAHALLIPYAKLSKSRGDVLTHQCLMSTGLGGLNGLWKRFRGYH